MKRTSIRRLRGLSMIEILVTLVIVAFGVLGLLGLQARALSFQKDSFDRRNSAEMVAQLAERARANHLGFVSGNYAMNFSIATATPAGAPATCAAPAACTIAEVAARDRTQWAIELRRRMPGSAAYLEWNAADPRTLLVTLAWVEPTQGGAVTTGADATCADLNARLAAGLSAQYRCYRTSIFP